MTVEFKSQELISDSYPHSHKAVFVWGEGPKIFFFNLMLNLKNNENNTVFDEICKKKQKQKKKTKIKIKFKKMNGSFLDSISWMKSH